METLNRVAPTHGRGSRELQKTRQRHLVEDEMHCPDCGCIFKGPKKRRTRSVAQHRRFFGLIGKAFQHWPHSHEFAPRDAEHLRAWLLVQAGYRDVPQTIRCEDADPERLTAVLRASFQAAKSSAFVECQGSKVYVVTPKSLKFEKLSHSQACAVMSVVDGIIEDVIGVPTDSLLEAPAA